MLLTESDEIPTDNEEALHLALRKNDSSFIETLLALQVNVNWPDYETGLTPLHVAGSCNKSESYLKIVEILLNNGANVNAQDSAGNTPLHYLAKNGNKKIVQLVLKYNPDVSIKAVNGDTPLNTAVCWKNFEAVELLVGFGANVNYTKPDGVTVLQQACARYNEKITKFLFKNGAKIEASSWTPFDNILYHFCNKTDERPRRILTFLLKYVNINIQENFLRLDPKLMESNFAIQDIWQVSLEHVAELQALDLYVNPNIFDTILRDEDLQDYFNKCKAELLLAKNTKIKHCWITYFNLLVDNQKKLKNYAGNQDLIENYKITDCFEKFPIYGFSISKNVIKGITRRKLFDQSADKLSNVLPIFSPTHLIIKDIFDCMLNVKDLSIFVK